MRLLRDDDAPYNARLLFLTVPVRAKGRHRRQQACQE